jgi:hypothetical protein
VSRPSGERVRLGGNRVVEDFRERYKELKEKIGHLWGYL